jgi:hypothetical protein
MNIHNRILLYTCVVLYCIVYYFPIPFFPFFMQPAHLLRLLVAIRLLLQHQLFLVYVVVEN